MEDWDPLTGKIPPDPPDAIWHTEAGDPPAEIITRMRDVWKLLKCGSPEDARAIFARAGEWLDYWCTDRADADTLDRRGIIVDARARPDTWRGYLTRPDDGSDIEVLPASAEAGADNLDRALAPILAIHSAHQAILTGRRACWGRAMEMSAAAQKPISDGAIPGRMKSNKALEGVIDHRARAKQKRSESLRREAMRLINAGVSRKRLHLRLARQEWPDVMTPESGGVVQLQPDTIQRLLKEIEDADPDAFRPAPAPN